MSFDATPGGSSSDTYVTLEEAKAYFKTRLHSSLWGPFADKKAALITATRLLERWVKWQGIKKTGTQALHWPADGAVDRDGYFIPNHIIPVAVKEATCEMAYVMLEEDLTATDDMAGYHSLKVGSLQIVADPKTKARTIPEAVWKAIAEYGRQPAVSQARVVRW